jgi:hypothetical protein
VPDLANKRLLISNTPSRSVCPGIDIIEVPLAAPAGSSLLRFEPAGRPCHDIGVILGRAKLAACAGGNGFTVWSLANSLEDPEELYSVVVPEVTIGHSASFTWDGKVLIFGHEPGRGVAPRCTPTGTVLPDGTVQTDAMKTFFFYDTADGSLLGRWVLPRDQTVTENCTLHNYNIVPLRDRYVVVSGNYQSGISVVDFTDPANAREIALADPVPLSETELILGGDWSSYWYNGRIYESDITRRLLVWNSATGPWPAPASWATSTPRPRSSPSAEGNRTGTRTIIAGAGRCPRAGPRHLCACRPRGAAGARRATPRWHREPLAVFRGLSGPIRRGRLGCSSASAWPGRRCARTAPPAPPPAPGRPG